MMDASRRAGKMLNALTCVVDMNGFSSGHMHPSVLRMMRNRQQLDEKTNYPELFRR
jgi:hypothetical protein